MRSGAINWIPCSVAMPPAVDSELRAEDLVLVRMADRTLQNFPRWMQAYLCAGAVDRPSCWVLLGDQYEAGLNEVTHWARLNDEGVAAAEPSAGPSAVSLPSVGDAAAVPNANTNERILCAAIHIDDGRQHLHQPVNIYRGFVVAGRRHHNCIYTASLLAANNPALEDAIKSRDNQGFLTSRDRYVSRSMALAIARREGQLLVPEMPQEILTSEDLY